METKQNPDMRTAMAKVKPSTVTEIIPSMVGRTSALASANAPFIFFDVATSFGVNGGVAAITVVECSGASPEAPPLCIRRKGWVGTWAPGSPGSL